ncbi:MAG TPA: hypothetical protein VK790_12240 [Solirubrobacteraceae bacterium]|jgi:hypothetical protein|nr:hypothetical protein [Solirubrobacteraceae bacterium]
MPSAGEIRAQVASEQERRTKLAVPAFAGGFLYLLSAIIVFKTLNGGPTVGLIEGLGPALNGVANPAHSPATAELKYLSHEGFALISGSVIAALSIAALVLVLLLFSDAVVFRRPHSWRLGRPLVLYGGVAFAVLSVARQLTSALVAHKFAVGHDYSLHAFEQSTTGSSANLIVGVLGPLAGIALAAGMIGVLVNTVRVGLLPLWMSVLGSFSALLLFFPIGGAELQVVPALWLVVAGVLFIGRWPKGEPPAWQAGEARPWPSQAQLRAERGERGGRAGRGRAAAAKAEDSTDLAATPEPVLPTGGGAGTSRKRRRKRGGRG